MFLVNFLKLNKFDCYLEWTYNRYTLCTYLDLCVYLFFEKCRPWAFIMPTCLLGTQEYQLKQNFERWMGLGHHTLLFKEVKLLCFIFIWSVIWYSFIREIQLWLSTWNCVFIFQKQEINCLNYIFCTLCVVCNLACILQACLTMLY